MNNQQIKQACCVIGDPIDHSLSAFIHTAGYKHLKIEDQFEFFAKRIQKEDLKTAFNLLKEKKIRGVSVTLPHKISVIKHIDKISKAGARIGAVNTIIRQDDGSYLGTNTDYHGIIRPIQKVRSIKGCKVAIIGAGGSARAALYGLTTRGAECTVFNRTLNRAEKLKKDFELTAKPLSAAYELCNFDVIINCTSLGMNALDILPVPNPTFHADQIVFDCVYNTGTTDFLKKAQRDGATIIKGSEMFIEQAAKQFLLYTGNEISVSFLRKTLEKMMAKLEKQ